MSYIKFIRIFLLVLIVVGIGLLLTQKVWVPGLVNKILIYQKFEPSIEPVDVGKASNVKPDSFEWCIARGGKDWTPKYNAPKKCILENRVYEENCVGNNKYLAISKDSNEGVGSDTLVKYKSSPNQTISCEYVTGKGDFEIKDEWTQYLLSLENNLLFFDSGTGPDQRGIIIYDLDKRLEVYNDSYTAIVPDPIDIGDNYIKYWNRTDKNVTTENCPRKEEYYAGGLGAAIDEHVVVNLTTFAKKELGEYRCSPVQ